MTIEKFKIPISMLSPTVDPAQLGFDDTSVTGAPERNHRARAGERGLDGEFAPDTAYGRAAQRLAELAQAIAEWSEGETKQDGRIITEL